MKIITHITISLLIVSATFARAGSAQENWNKDCMQCHGKSGAADTKMGQKLNAKRRVSPTPMPPKRSRKELKRTAKQR